MSSVYLITSGQVNAARLSLQLVATFITAHTSEDSSIPKYTHARSRALELLANLDEAWQHLPTISRIGQG